MEIKVLFFSLLRDVVGTDEIVLSLESKEQEVSEILDELYRLHPELKSWDSRMLVALNQEYAERNEVVQSGDELALMPPVQGG